MWMQYPTLLWRIGQQSWQKQSLSRTPEPGLLIEGSERSDAYDEGGEDSNLLAIYAFVCDLLESIAPAEGRALDIACGSGQLTRLMSNRLQSLAFTGLELSPDMLEKAKNHKRSQQDINFIQGDMFDLSGFEDNHFNLTTWTLAAHHTDTPEQVVSVLQQLQRVTHPDGAILVFDLGRLKTRALCQWYVEFSASDYEPMLKEEFSQSVFAAYTSEEMIGICEKSGVQGFKHYALAGLPTLQLLMRPARSKAVINKMPRGQRLVDSFPPEIQKDYEMICTLFKRGGLRLT